MNNRRQFLGTLLLATPLAAQTARSQETPASSIVPAAVPEARSQWVRVLTRVAEPVLANLAANQLKARMPLEAMNGREADRRAVTHLEALGRTLGGIAPWLGVAGANGAEDVSRARFALLVRQALANAVDPAAADRLDFTTGAQNLVDAAFLALGLSRARVELWEKLDAPVRERIAVALASTRRFKPGRNNWLLFSALIEAFLARVGAEWQPEPI